MLSSASLLLLVLVAALIAIPSADLHISVPSAEWTWW
jgi:hypothetical protein